VSLGGEIVSHKYGFALPTSTSCVPAIAENRNTEMKAAIKSAFFSTGNPCLIPSFFVIKGFLSRFLD
jgi:hypothetical protein